MISVERWGRGALVMLVPGLGRAATDYADLGAALAEAGFEAIACNPRGVAGNPPAADEATLHDYAADVAEVIEHFGHGERVHVGGHMAGQRVARTVATDRPDLTRSLVLLAAGGRHPPLPGTPEALLALLDESTPRAARREHLAAAFFAPGNDPTPWVDGWWPAAGVAQGAATWRTPIEEWWLPPSAIPLLVVQGLDDRIALPANGRELVVEHGNARLVEIAGAGHALLPEQPVEVAAAVVAFLRDVEAGAFPPP